MNHLPFLLEREVYRDGNAQCGHALMASCPPRAFSTLGEETPFGHDYPQDQPTTDHQTWTITKGDLKKLLNLSRELKLNGEITPVQAWSMVLSHPRLTELTSEDLDLMVLELKDKVRCYGYVPERRTKALFLFLLLPPVFSPDANGRAGSERSWRSFNSRMPWRWSSLASRRWAWCSELLWMALEFTLKSLFSRVF
jgi:hypothetical protein